MKKKKLFVILFIFCFIGINGTTQEDKESLKSKNLYFLKKKLIDKSKQPIYINARIWLVFSLARFDIAIDNNLIEVRADVQIRRESKDGELISVADVRVDNQRMIFNKDRFKIKRIMPGKFLDQVVLKLHIPDGPCIKQVITIPTWIRLVEPKPAIYNGTSDLDINWVFTRCGSYANLRVHNFHTGKQILEKAELTTQTVKLPLASLDAGESLLRVFVIEPWFHVKKARDPLLTEDSEISCISWSQSFIRVKK